MGSSISNWTAEDTNKSLRQEAQRVLDDYKSKRAKKRYKTVKVSDNPPTWKEVEIKG